MRVHWTKAAVEQLDAISAYLSSASPSYALRTVDRITRKSQQIALFPLSGRRVPEYALDQIREVFVDSYRIIYHIKPDRIDVVTIIHGAMLLQP